MNRPLLCLLAVITALLLCFQVAFGQQDNSTKPTANAALREKAFKLLESLADQLGTLQSAENRARMGSNIAASLWSHDEQRARALFQLVEDDIKLGLQRQNHDPDSAHTFQVFLKLREDNVERIAKHDPQLALRFLRETLAFLNETTQRPDGKFPLGMAQREQALQLRLAKRIAASDPEAAVQIARQSVEHGLSEDLLFLLLRISSKNKDQAQVLYAEIVRKLRDADFKQYYPVARFAQQLAGMFTPPAADESTYRELMNAFLTKASAHGCERPRTAEIEERNSPCVYLGVLVPLIERFYPAQAQRLMHWVPEDRQFRFDSITPAYVELNELSENGTVDEILALASSYPQLEGDVYARAMARAERDGDFERARQIARTYAGDPALRTRLQERIKFYDIPESELEERLAETQKNVHNLPPHQQANLLFSLASYAAPRNKKFAVRVLDQISRFVDTLPPGENQTHYQMVTAMVYCLANDERGFALMESLLPKLNELIAAAAKLDRYDTRYLRNGEWNMSGAGSVGKILTALAQNATYFAWCDFDRAVTLAGQFERSEIRMMAQLKLAQGILAGPSKQQLAVRPRY